MSQIHVATSTQTYRPQSKVLRSVVTADHGCHSILRVRDESLCPTPLVPSPLPDLVLNAVHARVRNRIGDTSYPIAAGFQLGWNQDPTYEPCQPPRKSFHPNKY